jgi:hypothetical protein
MYFSTDSPAAEVSEAGARHSQLLEKCTFLLFDGVGNEKRNSEREREREGRKRKALDGGEGRYGKRRWETRRRYEGEVEEVERRMGEKTG